MKLDYIYLDSYKNLKDFEVGRSLKPRKKKL